MTCAVIIDLDYQALPREQAGDLWIFISQAMLEAGFIQDGRRFISREECKESMNLARDAIEELEAHKDYYAKRVFSYIRDFYAFDMATATNLLLPALDGIDVEERVPG